MLNGETIEVCGAITGDNDNSTQAQDRATLLADLKKRSPTAGFASDKRSQKQARRLPEFDVQARCAQVAAGIESGDIVLPDLEKGAAWTILDTGSTISAADYKKCVPWAKLNPNSKNRTYHTATREAFGDKGDYDIQWSTENGHVKSANFLNAPVATPITSQHKWNRDGHQTLTDEHGNHDSQ